MGSYRTFFIAIIILALFAPLILVSPERVTKSIRDWFDLYPSPPPAKAEVPGRQILAQSVKREITREEVEAHLIRLTRSGSRVPGYPGHVAAHSYLTEAFKKIGLEDVSEESCEVTSPIDKGCSLKLLGENRKIPLHAIWPNLVRTSTLPTRGLRGLLIDGGSGEFADFNGEDLDGNIVLISFNSWNRWMNASMLGAGAVIFVAPDSTTTAEAKQKFLDVPLSVPRFWLDRRAGQELRGRLASGERIEATVHGRMVWEKNLIWNVVGRISGTDLELKNRTVVLEAYYDAMSVVPALAPGAEQASGIVALLEIAEYLKGHPPAHSVLFLATPAHHLGMRGVSRFLDLHARKADVFAARMTDPLSIGLWISLDLSSHTDEMGIYSKQSFLAPLGERICNLSRQLAPSLGLDSEALVDGITLPTGMSWEMFIPGEDIKTNYDLARLAGLASVAFVTINDARLRVDTPFDVIERVRTNNLTLQIQLLAGVLREALNDPNLLVDQPAGMRDGMRALSGRVVTFPRRSILPDKPRPGAIVAFQVPSEKPKSVKGVRSTIYELTDGEGEFYISGLGGGEVALEAYYLDPETGAITYAPNQGAAGSIYPIKFKMANWITRSTSVVFPCITTDFYDLVDPRHLSKLTSLVVYGAGNTAPQEYGYSIGFGSGEPVGVIFTRPGESVKLMLSGEKIGIRLLLLNAQGFSSEKEGQGVGFTRLSHGAITHTSSLAARDMWRLDEARIQELASYGVRSERLDILHARAKYHLDRAQNAREALAWDEYMKHSRSALGIESRAYPDVKATQNDIVRGVVFFMLLVIPFAFFAERMLITASEIYKQVAWIALIFAAIWIVLSAVHPAFGLSHPVVILLAFVILFLGIFVITIIFTRFNTHVRQRQSQGSAVHGVDVGRISASVAAFQLGIANMKRRKLRTGLTFTTLVLLTFTVLSFTSVKTSLRYHQIRQDRPGLYPGFLIRSRFWGPLEQSALDYARADFEGEAEVVPRSWYASKLKKAVRLKHGDRSVNALGIVGLTAAEKRVTGIESCLVAGRWFREEERQVCVMPKPMADLLGIQEGSTEQAHIRLFGESFKVVGLLDPDRMKALVDLDGEPLTPADFVITDATELKDLEDEEDRQKVGMDQPSVEIAESIHLEPKNVLIVPYQTLREVSSPLQSVAVRFQDPTVVKSRVEDFISRLAVVLFAGIPTLDEDGKIERVDVSTYSSLGHTALSGLGNLFIPIAIAALIVLNTMMGSVHERLPEIGTYSAVGLAPVHIAFLFLAESCVYAVLGTVSGYLLGQIIAKLVLWQGGLTGLALNYSSLSAVASSALVMVVVVGSTIYPAWSASRMAVPDVTRRWTLAPPDGDEWRIEFPFTVGSVEIPSLFAFLTRYLDYHTEGSMGTFYTEGANRSKRFTDEGECLVIESRIWLAPYDLGVSQDVRLESRPLGEFDICELHLTVQRLSGDDTSWRRCNQRFINQLRKQFLIWRTIDEEEKKKYGEEGKEEGWVIDEQ